MKLSILICSVGDRLDKAIQLYGKLVGQNGYDASKVEILMLTDNRNRSIGMKRQALLDMSKGDYVCYVDDDDDVAEIYMSTLLGNIYSGPHVFIFPTLCESKEHGSLLVCHSIHHCNEAATAPAFNRKPWFMHPIRSDIAKASSFSDKNWGEDNDWLMGVWPYLRNQVTLSHAPLYIYNWDDDKGEV